MNCFVSLCFINGIVFLRSHKLYCISLCANPLHQIQKMMMFLKCFLVWFVVSYLIELLPIGFWLESFFYKVSPS